MIHRVRLFNRTKRPGGVGLLEPRPNERPKTNRGQMSEAASEAPGVKLRQLLIAVGDPLVDVLAAPGGFDVPVRDVVILDPDDQADTHTGELVRVIGARGRAAIRLVRAAARRGAVAVAVKVDGDEDVSTLRDTAMDGGIALLGVRPEVRWEQLESLARSTV